MNQLYVWRIDLSPPRVSICGASQWILSYDSTIIPSLALAGCGSLPYGVSFIFLPACCTISFVSTARSILDIFRAPRQFCFPFLFPLGTTNLAQRDGFEALIKALFASHFLPRRRRTTKKACKCTAQGIRNTITGLHSRSALDQWLTNGGGTKPLSRWSNAVTLFRFGAFPRGLFPVRLVCYCYRTARCRTWAFVFRSPTFLMKLLVIYHFSHDSWQYRLAPL